MRGEFELIAQHFAPLAAGAAGSFGLGDDAAVIASPAGRDLVYTTDTICSGVHYLADDPPGEVACKLLRVNLSDLAAMGARPEGYLLNAAFARDVAEAWIEAFAQGLGADQHTFGLPLWGGDTTSTPGPTTLSLTAVGTVPAGSCLRRSGARAGDALYVSGTIGDGALGLKAALGDLPADALEEHDRAYLVDRYRRPRPRLALGQALLARGITTAALDVSDGLVADLGHLCAASGVAAEIAAAAVPLSAPVQRLVEREAGWLTRALTGGDDYELAFAVAPEHAGALGDLAAELDLPLTRIGRLGKGAGVTVRARDGTTLQTDAAGWQHF